MSKILKYGITLLLLISALVFSGCSIVKTVKTINSGSIDCPLKGDRILQYKPIDNTIFVKVRINDSEKEYNFIFDTGAINAIDDDLAEQLGLEKVSSVKAVDAGGLSSETGVYKSDKLSIEGIVVKNPGLIALDLSFIEKILDTEVDGIIGNNFLKFFAVTINYEDSTLIFSSQTERNIASNNYYTMDFAQNMSTGYSPEISCRFGDYETKAYIDCGNSGYITFPNENLEKSGILKFPHVISEGSGSGGAFGIPEFTKTYLIRIPNFSIGSFTGEKILIQSGEGSTILIGNDFLSQFNVKINYPEKQIVLFPFKDKPEFDNNPQEIGFSAIKTEQQTFKTVLVLENSSAWKAGIKQGDEIIEINGIETGKLTNDEFGEIKNQAESLDLVIKRDGDEIKISVTKNYLFIND